jgi:hypothetical protein
MLCIFSKLASRRPTDMFRIHATVLKAETMKVVPTFYVSRSEAGDSEAAASLYAKQLLEEVASWDAVINVVAVDDHEDIENERFSHPKL